MSENENENVKNEMVSANKEISPMLQQYNDNWKIASQYAKSNLVPDNYKGKAENVIVALGLSQKMDIDLFTVMQNLNIVRGKASWSGSFCRTLIEKTGKFSNLDLVYIGEKGKDNFGCYMQAVRKSDGKIIKGSTVDMAMVKAEKWNTNSKWNSMTELMLGYRATSFFARLYCPEALNGVYTSEEVEDISNQQPTEISDILED